MKLSLNVIALIVCGVVGFPSSVSGTSTDNTEVITYSILGTIGVEIVLGVIAFFIWKNCKAKTKRDSSKVNSELHGHDNGAFFANPDVSAAEQGLGHYENKREYPRSAKIHSPSHSTSPNEKSWNSLPKVQFAGPNLPRHGSYASLDNNINSQDPEIVSVNLQSQDFIGLGFNISGSMRDGIFISEVHNRGPAIESGVLKVGDRILSVTISFENMVFEDALTILSYASPYPVNICVQKHNPNKTSGSYKANGFEMQLNHPLYRSQSLDALTRIMKESLPKRSYSELKSDNKKDNSFVKQPNFIKDLSSTMKDLSSSKSGIFTTNDDYNDTKRDIPVSTQISEVVIHKPPVLTDLSLPLKEESYFEAPTLEKNRDLKDSIKLREPYKLHVYDNSDYTETLESTPKPGSDIKFPMFDSDDSISKLDEQMDIHFSNCDKEFEDLKQKADEDNFKLDLDFNAERKSDLNSPNSETEFENLEKKIELSSNFADIFDRLTDNTKFPELNLSFDDFSSKETEPNEDTVWTRSKIDSNNSTDFFLTADTSTNLMTESNINTEKENNPTLGTSLNSTDFFLTAETSTNLLTESNLDTEKENTARNLFNSDSSGVCAMRMENFSDWKDPDEHVKSPSTDLLLKSNEEDGLLILPTRVEFKDEMREDCLEKLLPKSSAKETSSSPEIKEQHLGETAFDKFDSAKETAENLKDDNESELLSLKNIEVNCQAPALECDLSLSASDPRVENEVQENTLYSVENKVQESTLYSIKNKVLESTPYNIENKVQENTLYSVESKVQENTPYSIESKDQENTLYSVENKVQETIPDILDESSSFTPAFVKPTTKMDSVDTLLIMTKDDVDASVWKPELSPNETLSSHLTPEVTTGDISSSFFNYEIKTQDVDPSISHSETETTQIDSSIFLPKVNADDDDPFLKTDGTNSPFMKYELQTEERDSSLLKPETHGVDSSIYNQEDETARIDSSILLPEVNTDVADPLLTPDGSSSSFLKYELKTEEIDSPLLEPETHSVDSSILNLETDPTHMDSAILLPEVSRGVVDPLSTHDGTNSPFLEYEQETGEIGSSLLKPEITTDSIDKTPLENEVGTNPSFLKYEQKQPVDSSFLRPENNTDGSDTDSSEYEVKTDDIKVSLLKTNDANADETNTSISTPGLEQIRQETLTSSSSDSDEDEKESKKSLADTSLTEPLKDESLDRKTSISSGSSESSSESEHDVHAPPIEIDKPQEKLTDRETPPTDSTLLKSEKNTDNFGLPFFKPAVKTDVLPSESSDAVAKDSVFRVEKKIVFTEPIKLHVTSTKHTTGEKSVLEIPKLDEKEEDVNRRHKASSPIQTTEEQSKEQTSGRLTPYKYHLKTLDLKDIGLGAENSTNKTSDTAAKGNHSEKRKTDHYFARPVNITPKATTFTKPILKPDALQPKTSLDFPKDTTSKEAGVSRTDSNTQVKSSSEESSIESESEEQKSDETTDQNEEKSHCKLSLFKRIPQKDSSSSSSDSDEDETVGKKSLAESFLTQPLKAESLDGNATVSTHSSESSSEREYTVNPLSTELEKPQRNLTDTDVTPTPSLGPPNDSGEEEQEETAEEEEEEEEEGQDKKDEAFFEMTEDELSTDTQSLSPKSAVTRAISCDGGFVTSDDSDLSKPRSNSINQEIQLPGHEDNYMDWSGQSLVRRESFSQIPDSALVWTGTDHTEDGKGKSDSDSDDSNNDAVTQSDMYKPRENLTQLSLSNSSSSISSNETKTNGERGNDSETSFETMELNFSRPFSESNHKTDLLRPREEDNKMVSTNYEGHGAFTVTFSAQSDTDA